MLTIEEKISVLKESFAACQTPAERYDKLIELGREQPPLPASSQTPQNRVEGCQSTLYLASRLESGKLIFEASADALISSGLAAILIAVYSGETPETILQTPPTFLQDIGLLGSLTPSRSSGLAQIHRRMKQDAVKYLLASKG